MGEEETFKTCIRAFIYHWKSMWYFLSRAIWNYGVIKLFKKN